MTSGQPPFLEQIAPRDKVSHGRYWLAFTSLACGLAQSIFLVLFAWPAGPTGIVLSGGAAVVLGVVALMQGGSTDQRDKAMAIAGVIMGSLGLLLIALIDAFVILANYFLQGFTGPT
jgi:MFS family permease